ncbi:hypothetical protein H4219_003554 [Mycoemilia scoparia]|uniref:Uncharacterized protein n=1 Tax=Mycoemilia scoparia TaxID=417184 RepID=A0A9W8A0W4_9FUNG|nr:hypothetical protein H4219_003554 [Mycoemilia scoparia]
MIINVSYETFWAVGTKMAAQALFDQAKEYIDAHGLFKNDQNASSTDHDRVLCIWKLFFAANIIQHLYLRLRKSKNPVDEVTIEDCEKMIQRIKEMAKPIIDGLGVEDYESYIAKYGGDANAVVAVDLSIEKLREFIASEPIDITNSVMAITFYLGEEEDVELVYYISYISNGYDPKQCV